jgi:hypothetical protein
MARLVIPGGTDLWFPARRGEDFLWPSNHRLDDFRVGTKHTVFEWVLICTWLLTGIARHPAALLGADLRKATNGARADRLLLIGAAGSNERMPVEGDGAVWDEREVYQRGNKIYQGFVEGITGGRIPAKPVFLDDRPSELDFTLHVVGVRAAIELMRPYGNDKAIGTLLAVEASGRSPTRDKIIEAGEALMEEGHVPPETIPWKRFRKLLWRKLGVKPGAWGYGKHTIENALRPILKERRAKRIRALAAEEKST